MAILHSLYFSIHYNTQVYQVTSHLDYNNCFPFISSSYNSCYKFVFTCDCLLCKILFAVLDIVICLTFLCVTNLHVLCNGTVSVNYEYKISLVVQNYNSNQILEFMFLHYQKLHLKCFEQMCVKCILGLCFVVYICVLHLFCTDYQYLYWDFCTAIHSYCPGLI